MSSNTTGGGRLVHRPLGFSMECLDRLPERLRRRVNEAAIALDPVQLLGLYQQWSFLGDADAAERQLLDALDRTEALELARFAAAYSARHGVVLPHVAAGASTLRG